MTETAWKEFLDTQEKHAFRRKTLKSLKTSDISNSTTKLEKTIPNISAVPMAKIERNTPKREGKLYPTAFNARCHLQLTKIFQDARDWREWTIEEMVYVANRPPEELGKCVRPIMSEIIRRGHKAFIPIDIIKLLGLDEVNLT